MKTWKSIKNFFPYLKPERNKIIASILFSLGAVVFNGLSPYFVGQITTSLTNSVMHKEAIHYSVIFSLLGIFLLCTLGSSGFQFLATQWLTKAVQKTMANLRFSLVEKLDRLPQSFFDKESKGDLLSRLTNDVDLLTTSLQQTLSDLLSSILKVVFAIGMMFYIQKSLAWTVFIFIIAVVVVTKIIISYSQRYFKVQQATLGEFNSFVEEQLKGRDVITSYQLGEKRHGIFQRLNQKLEKALFRSTFCSKLLAPLLNLLVYIFYSCIAFAGSMLCLNGQLAIGQLQAFIQYIWQVNQPLTQLSQMANMIQSGLAGWERISYLLEQKEEEPEIQYFTEKSMDEGEVKLEDVSFGYDQEMVLKDLSVTIPHGATFALVGATGAGKSTFIQLLMRFYEPTTGKIFLNGKEESEWSLEEWRHHFSFVTQKPWLFAGTVLENLQIAAPKKTEAEIIEIAKKYHIDEMIQHFPKGYQTQIQPQENGLSVGERQALTILRAILQEAPIMIMDEATSSIDTQMEQKIQRVMDEVLKNHTTIMIAHRLSTIEKADQILVLDQGRIVEQGTHDELLKEKGIYAKMQAQSSIEA
ncbi:ABC transporter ATP-binding protein [Catellicoccus marimammalium]|uniref:Lipid A export ATP-binding/permease proteiN n=1 Tax=Catellicoccus marimammalium M35/04/3 TaxID=1234409 RepID=K8Z7H3_9ENTE|nr:ABC transporter ATP-binding protein [Catellicoccus marimammalium]EKU26954.1 Lipid A export ATP-binding/permease proteiN [Catellicoccus marimammalium M35/04/3]